MMDGLYTAFTVVHSMGHVGEKKKKKKIKGHWAPKRTRNFKAQKGGGKVSKESYFYFLSTGMQQQSPS